MQLLEFSSDVGNKFRQVVRGNNWITPTILGYITIKDGIAEISKGPKFLDLDMYGVTIIKDGIKNNELSKCVNSMKEVQSYINELNL